MSLFATPSDGARKTSRPFPAKYGGTCSRCTGYIEIGEEIMFDDDELVHSDCTEDVRRPGTMPAVCSKCFIAHAGECF